MKEEHTSVNRGRWKQRRGKKGGEGRREEREGRVVECRDNRGRWNEGTIDQRTEHVPLSLTMTSSSPSFFLDDDLMTSLSAADTHMYRPTSPTL